MREKLLNAYVNLTTAQQYIDNLYDQYNQALAERDEAQRALDASLTQCHTLENGVYSIDDHHVLVVYADESEGRAAKIYVWQDLP